MLNKNTLGVKKCEANQKQHASRQVRLKALISAGQEVSYFIKQLLLLEWHSYTIVYSIYFTIGFVTWPPFILLGLSWYQSLVAPACLHVASDWPRTFFTPKVFLFNISLLFVNKYHYFVEAYKQMLLWSLILKNSRLRFLNIYYRVIATSNHLKGVQAMATISLQCNSLSKIYSSAYFSWN